MELVSVMLDKEQTFVSLVVLSRRELLPQSTERLKNERKSEPMIGRSTFPTTNSQTYSRLNDFDVRRRVHRPSMWIGVPEAVFRFKLCWMSIWVFLGREL